MSFSSSALITPICAMPVTPPPLKTSPTFSCPKTDEKENKKKKYIRKTTVFCFNIRLFVTNLIIQLIV